jgi:hypothetical protein
MKNFSQWEVFLLCPYLVPRVSSLEKKFPREFTFTPEGNPPRVIFIFERSHAPGSSTILGGIQY